MHKLPPLRVCASEKSFKNLKDVVKAYKSKPEPVSRISVFGVAIKSLPLQSIAAIVMTLHVLRLALQAQ